MNGRLYFFNLAPYRMEYLGLQDGLSSSRFITLDIYELKVALTPSRPARATKDAVPHFIS